MVSEAAREKGHLSAELEAAESGWLIAKARLPFDALSNFVDAHILDEKIADAKHAEHCEQGRLWCGRERESQSLWLQRTSRKIRSAIFNEEYMVLKKYC